MRFFQAPHLFHLAHLWLNGLETFSWIACVVLLGMLLRDKTGGHRLLLSNIATFAGAEVFFHLDIWFDVVRVGRLDDWFWALFKTATFIHCVTYAWLQYPNIRRTLQFAEAARLVGSMGLTILSDRPMPASDAKEEEHLQLRRGTLQVSRSLREQLEKVVPKGVEQHGPPVAEGLAGHR